MGQRRNGSHLILMELMFVLFFFAICGAILLQVFVKSHNISVEAKELTETKNYVTQAAQLFEAGYTNFDQYQKYFPKLQQKEDCYDGYFDENFDMTTKKDAVYHMIINLKKYKTNITGKITMLKGKKQIYQLDLLKHLPERKSYEKS